MLFVELLFNFTYVYGFIDVSLCIQHLEMGIGTLMHVVCVAKQCFNCWHSRLQTATYFAVNLLFKNCLELDWNDTNYRLLFRQDCVYTCMCMHVYVRMCEVVKLLLEIHALPMLRHCCALCLHLNVYHHLLPHVGL